MKDHAVVWTRWQKSLRSSRNYENPYSDVQLSVTYKGPSGQKITAPGFWDGGNIFRIRCAFPQAGTWAFTTRCSNPLDKGLHGHTGTVDVRPYIGKNPLFNKGFLKIGKNRRHLAFQDETPFFWNGDTAWLAPMRARESEFAEYLKDRVKKEFTLLQFAQVPCWAGDRNVNGVFPFLGKENAQWNPRYWQEYERFVQMANESGLVVFVAALMRPTFRYPKLKEAKLFARNLVARFFGNFVIFSPTLDDGEPPSDTLAGKVAEEIDKSSTVHLIAQHPGTSYEKPLGKPAEPFINTTAEYFFSNPHLDIAANQSGHHEGNIHCVYKSAIDANLHLFNRKPHKPVINTEAMYARQYYASTKFKSTDAIARCLGYLSWLSGSLGYTYGADGLKFWERKPASNSKNSVICSNHWKKAMKFPSSMQMKYMHQFFASLNWWNLEPAHDLILDQVAEQPKKVLAKTRKGNTIIAYLPTGGSIKIKPDGFQWPLQAKWFNPINGKYTDPKGKIVKTGKALSFKAPGKGDWVLLIKA